MSNLELTGYLCEKDNNKFACFEENGCRALIHPENSAIVLNVERLFSKTKHCDAIIANRREDSFEIFFIEVKCIVDEYDDLVSDIIEKAVGSAKFFKAEFNDMPLIRSNHQNKYFILFLRESLMRKIGHMISKNNKLKAYPMRSEFRGMCIKKSGSFVEKLENGDIPVFGFEVGSS